MKQYAFDDIEGMQELVSEEWGEWSSSFEVTQEVINQFADLTGDHNFLHVDLEAAAKSPFGSTIAHGFLTLALMTQLKGEASFEVTGFNTMVNYGSNKLRFTGAVPSGSEIHLRSRVKSVILSPKGTGTQVTIEQAIHVVGQERPSVIYELIMFYM
jgi:acyl dehydratase